MVRNFQGYVEDRTDAILGAGVSAISQTPRLLWQSSPELAPWRDSLRAGRLPVERGVELDEDDQLRRDVIGRLMCDGEVELTTLARAHGVDATRYFERELHALTDIADLATFDGSRIQTTPLGRLLVRNVCMVFDRYAQPVAAMKFSSTI